MSKAVLKAITDPQGKVHTYWEPPAEKEEGVAEPSTPEGFTLHHIEASLEEFEAAAREDAGIGPDEPLGDMYLTDEPTVSAAAKPDKPGRRMGNKRLKAYPPDTTTVAERLAQDLGAKGNHNVTWAALAEYERRMRG